MRIVDLVGKDVIIELATMFPGTGDELHCTLDYVTRGWVGVSSIYRARIHRDHFPVSAIRRIKVIEPARRTRS